MSMYIYLRILYFLSFILYGIYDLYIQDVPICVRCVHWSVGYWLVKYDPSWRQSIIAVNLSVKHIHSTVLHKYICCRLLLHTHILSIFCQCLRLRSEIKIIILQQQSNKYKVEVENFWWINKNSRGSSVAEYNHPQL